MLEFLVFLKDLLVAIFRAVTLWMALDGLEARVVDIHADLWRRAPAYDYGVN